MSKWKSLESLCTKITDGSHFSPKAVTNGIPMLSVKDMRHNGFDYNDCKFISIKDYEQLVKYDCKPLKNDILIAKDGSYLKHVFVIEEEINQVILSSIGILRPNLNLINPYFIKYYLHSDFVKREVAKKYVSGSALPRIILKNFGKIEVPYLDRNIQDKIVEVLSSLDAKIELNNRINAELEAIAKTLYDYWFVQFDFPDTNGNPYKSSGGKMVYNQEFKREIPKDWQIGNLGEFGEFKNGINYNLEETGDTKVNIINVRNISSSSLFISTDDLDEIILKGNDVRKYLVDEKSILIARSGIPGATRLIHDYLPNTIYCGFIICFTINNLLFKNNIFLHLKNFEKIATKQSNGTIMPNVNQETLKRIRIIMPDKQNSHVLEKFNQTIDPIFEKINRLSKENQQLTKLRDWLLPMLMNGQLHVENAEDVLAMAAEPEVAYGK